MASVTETLPDSKKGYRFLCTNCKGIFFYGRKELVPTVDGKEVCDECEKEMCGN